MRGDNLQNLDRFIGFLDFTKRSSNALLRLVRFFATQTLQTSHTYYDTNKRNW